MKRENNISSILIVDDEASQRLILRMILEQEGYTVYEARDGEEAFEIYAHNSNIRMVITDLTMPNTNGFQLIETIRKEQIRYVYLIVLTSSESKESVVRALSMGADDFLTKPAFPEELLLRVASGIRSLQLESQEELILSMAKLSEYRSDETGYHLERVQHYTRLLARDLAENEPQAGVTKIMAEEIARVSPLHDIGKIAIPDNILHKPGKLTEEEFETIKKHAEIGGNLLKTIYMQTGSPYLKIAYEIATHHHERFDGSGYPAGLKSTKIPIGARIMAMADVYDAITMKRCYKEPFDHETAKELILEARGSHLDPLIVDSFLRQEDLWKSVKQRFRD